MPPIRQQARWVSATLRFLPASLAILLSSSAYAAFKVEQDHSLPKTKFQQKPVVSEKAPVVLEAEQVHYDQQTNVVTAIGKVEVTQGETILLADSIVYDQVNDTVTAEGNISILEPNGNVYFADHSELKDNMKAGVIQQFKARLADNSLFVAARARKIDENKTELFNAIYSPCKISCDKYNEAGDPLWQLKAQHVLIDQKDQEVKYDNAYLDVAGVPIIYTPYFSHPTPGADNQSGLLTPTFLHSNNLGSVLKVPVFYSIARDKDITLTPIFTSKVGLVMDGEYRQMFDAGPLDLEGSITQANNTDALGNPVPGQQLRGHINGTGSFKINDNYDWGFNVHRTTDDTYLRLYNFSNETLLTSRAYIEGFNFGGNNRSYAAVQGLTFQGLTAQDDDKKIPIVMPLADFKYQSDPGVYNSRFSLSGNAMVLYRDTGDQSRRLSATAGWKLPYITDDGEVIEFNTQIRTDIYDVTDVALSNGRTYSGVTGREIPEASVLWHYPLINHWQNTSLMIEPVIEAAVSPGGGNPEKIPNEDSLTPEFNDSNLFSADRFAGLDRIESGPRMSYGVRGQAQFFSDKYVDWLFGQHYSVDIDPAYPLSNDPNSHFSDYVGKLGLTYQPFSIAYRFRLDKDNLAPKRNEVDASFSQYPLNLSLSYLSLKSDPILVSKQVITGNTSLNLTEHWLWNFTGNRDILLGQTGLVSTGFTYKNECTNLTSMVGRDFTRDRDIRPSTTFLFRISLKNLD